MKTINACNGQSCFPMSGQHGMLHVWTHEAVLLHVCFKSQQNDNASTMDCTCALRLENAWKYLGASISVYDIRDSSGGIFLTLNCSDNRSSKYRDSQRWSPSSMPLQGPTV